MEYLIHYSDGSEGYLAHHGIKGMEWGVWNEETRLKYLGSPPEYGKDSDFDLLDELSQGDIEDFYSSGKISGFGTKSGMRYYNSIPDERLTLPKDTTFTTYGSSDKNLDGPLWTTWKEDATSTYKGFGDTRYELSPKKDFLVASMKDSYDTFTDLFSDESESGQSFRSSVYETRLGPLGKEKAHIYASAASHYPEAAASDCYKSFTHNQYKKTTATNTFFKEMDSKGFDGILDQNDIDDYTKQSPVIVLNPSESLELKSSVKHSESFNKKYLAHTQLTENELQKRHYAFPEKRKFPLPDRDHVLSAIKFFNYASPNEERILADAILKRMRELGMSDVNVGPTNRFRKYYSGPELKHYGVKGMKWGVWNEETKSRYTSKYPTTNVYTKKKLGYKDDIVVPKGSTVYRVSKNKKRS